MQIADVCKRDEADAHHREYRFRQAMAYGDRPGHERKSDAPDRQRTDAPVAQDTVSKRDKSHHECHHKANAMYCRREKRLAAKAQGADQENPQYAMHRA